MVQSFLTSAGTGGPVLVRVLNNPFGGGPIESMVAEEATQVSRVPSVRFTSRPAEARQPDWHVVVIFNPVAGANVREACENAAAVRTVPAPANTQAIFSFCSGARMIAGVRANSGTVASASDPRLRLLVRRAMLDLFGQGDTDDGDGIFLNSFRPIGTGADRLG